MNDSPICVLIIDDSEEDRVIVRRLLNQHTQQTIRIVESDSAVDGWELCKTEHPDCILLDYQIPDIDGLEFISSLKHGRQTLSIPILMLTGHGDETIAADALKNGASDYLVKGSLTTEGLHRALTKAITQAELLRKNEDQHKEIERSQRELQQFAYTVTHDLQAPARRINSYLKLLEKDLNGQLNEQTHNYLRRAQNSAVHMQHFIKDLLDYSVLGGAEHAFEPVDLQAVIQDVLSEFEETIQEIHGMIHVDPLPSVLGNPTFLHQLFQNLLSNAVKFRSDQLLKVDISISSLGTHWLLKVKDNGIGISSEHLEKVFDIFERSSNNSKVEGTGIGLALCKKIVELHKGRIWVESHDQFGTTFNFTLPIMDSLAQKEQHNVINGVFSSLPESSVNSIHS